MVVAKKDTQGNMSGRESGITQTWDTCTHAQWMCKYSSIVHSYYIAHNNLDVTAK